MDLKEKLAGLVERFIKAKEEGKLDYASEETIRTWINELLSLFGWDVQNTHQVLQERTLEKDKRDKLRDIGSTNVRPDYTLANGSVLLSFIDAKSLEVNIAESKEASFQIRSYGWSIGAMFSIVTNFEQFAVYECSTMPRISDDPSVCRVKLYSCKDFVDNLDTMSSFLDRGKVISRQFDSIPHAKETLDQRFSKLLSEIRITLAKSIISENNGINERQINSYVQIILNRILFIRVCEARGMEEDGLLNKFAESDFWKNFKESSYLNFYNHYDGPMFSRIAELQGLSIDNEVFKQLLNYLYYPSPYRFDVIPLKTLSDMYDTFLGYKLAIKNGMIINELKPEYKKSNGAVTTPEHIVNKVIDSTMPEGILDDMSIDDIMNLDIVDPACGSGAFLVGAYNHINDIVLKKVADGESIDRSLIIFDKSNNPSLTIKGKKMLINNCIHGVDINPEAVEVARMSLSLKILDGYTPEQFETAGFLGSKILNGVGENVRCGNSLVSSDILDTIPSIADKLDEYENTNVFSWSDAFPNVFKKGGFDFVVGNPPYIEVRNYNAGLPSMAKYIKRSTTPAKKTRLTWRFLSLKRGSLFSMPKAEWAT